MHQQVKRVGSRNPHGRRKKNQLMHPSQGGRPKSRGATHRVGLVTLELCSCDLLLPVRLCLFSFPEPSKQCYNLGSSAQNMSPQRTFPAPAVTVKKAIFVSPQSWGLTHYWAPCTRLNYSSLKFSRKGSTLNVFKISKQKAFVCLVSGEDRHLEYELAIWAPTLVESYKKDRGWCPG